MLGLAVGTALAGAAAAEEARAPSAGASARWGHSLASDLMSPFCPGRILADCPSPDAATLRAWILVQEAAGRSREEVETELLGRYGEQLLSRP
jgi:cytochrome c-type biogenesis protein CcmH/NrfF